MEEDMTNGFDYAPECDAENNFIRLPDGWTGNQARTVLEYWPKWSDGSPCMFGDEFTCYPKYAPERKFEELDRLTIYGPNHIWRMSDGEERPHDGGRYEWNYMRPGGDDAEGWRPEKKVDEPVVDKLMELVEKVQGHPGDESARAECREIARWLEGKDE